MKNLFLPLFVCLGVLSACSDEDSNICKGISVDAGGDQSVAASYTVLDAVLPEGTSGEWSIISGVGGVINEAHNPISAFDGEIGETYVLRWTIDDCKNSFAEVSVSLTCDDISLANAGEDQTLVGNSTMLEAEIPSVGQGMWTIVSGENGVIQDPGYYATLFSGLKGVTYTLRWTVQSAICVENSNFDEMTVTFNEANLPAFADITRADIVAVQSEMSSASFGCVQSGSVIYPTGSVMVYKTNGGRYGKLEVVQWDANNNYRLTINVVTFDAEGNIYNQVNNLVIRGTWFADLDEAVETATEGVADFKNSTQSATDVNFEPKNMSMFFRK